MVYGQLLILPLVSEIPANAITKRQDQYLNVRVNYTWQGPARTITGYAVVTQETWYSMFDEIGSTKQYFSVALPESPASPTSGYFIVPNLPLSGCAVKTGYGVKVKVDDFAEWGSRNVLTIQAGAQQFGISSFSLS